MKAVCLLLLAFVVGSGAALAQKKEKVPAPEPMGANAEGTHFFVGFMENETDEVPRYIGQRTISIASRFSTRVEIVFPNGDIIQDNLKPFTLRTYEVSIDYECLGERVTQNAIEITSVEPISVYCYSSKHQTSDGYLALPVTSWGTEYISANYFLDHYTPPVRGDWVDTLFALAPRAGEFAIIAAENNTNVAIYPKTRTVTSGGASVMNRTLMKGEIFQVQDGGFIRGGSDLTGSRIVASKPVGLLSGHVRTGITYAYDSKDHLIEMLPPVNTLGKRHIVVPYGGRLGGDLVRVISSDPGSTAVQVTAGGRTFDYTIPNLGGFIEFDLNAVAVVTTDKPVLVTQYARSAGADPRNFPRLTVNFDPYMVVVTPEEQFVNGAIFQTLPNMSLPPGSYKQYDSHYVTLVGERDKFSTITLNGQPLPSFPKYSSGDVPGTQYKWASMAVPDGAIHILKGEALFGGYVYGVGNFDSYGWPVGSGLRKSNISDPNAPQLSDSFDCGGINITAREVGSAEAGLRRVWLDSSASENVTLDLSMLIIGDELAYGRVTLIDARTPGKGRIIAEDLSGNRDTLDVTIDLAKDLEFPVDSFLIADVEIGQTYPATFVVKNPNSDTVTVLDLFVANRKFYLTKIYKGTKIPPGGTLTIDILFQSDVRREQRDTLVLKLGCVTYRIPMVATIGAPKIATHDLDFGTLRVGRSRELTMRVWNPGNAPLRLDSAVLEGEAFAITASFAPSVILPPNEDTTIVVKFTPPSVGPFNGAVRFYSDADSIAIGKLTGIGIYPRITIGGYDFDSVQVGDTVCTRVPVANTGDDTAHITDIMLQVATGFVVDRSVLPADLAPGDTLWVPVCFVPQVEGPFISDIFPENSDGLEAKNTLRGVGYMLYALIDGCDWKERWVGTKHDTIIFIRNLSSAPITIYSVWASDGDLGDFKVEPLPGEVTIGANDSIPVEVQFLPLLPGLRSCMIRASTSSRQTPLIDSVLQGFGLMALASDSIDFDDSIAFSCANRTGTLTIKNDGNMPLTLEHIALLATPPGIVTLSAPSVGEQIPVGESRTISFTVDFNGYTGPVNGTISWSFEQLPDTITRSFSVASEPQVYAIEATTPRSVSIGSKFNLLVNVESVRWADVGEASVKLRIENNPTVARFNQAEWASRAASTTTGWRPYGTPVFDRPGVVTLEFRPVGVDSLPLDDVAFLAIPYEGFLGNSELDTFRITMIPEQPLCALPTNVAVPYTLDSICNLSGRLIDFTGGAYALRQSIPNPSSAMAEIEFTLGMEAPTTLELFSADGRLVHMLVDDILPAGEHVVRIDVNELPSGLYYYRLASGPYGAVRSMIVTK